MQDNPANSLGLDFNNKDSPDVNHSPSKETTPPTAESKSQPSAAQSPSSEQTRADTASTNQPGIEEKERKKPYVNPERVRTGGAQRVSLELLHKTFRVISSAILL